jgi:hypothetical protein
MSSRYSNNPSPTLPREGEKKEAERIKSPLGEI